MLYVQDFDIIFLMTALQDPPGFRAVCLILGSRKLYKPDTATELRLEGNLHDPSIRRSYRSN